MEPKKHELDYLGACTCGVFGCRRWRDNMKESFPDKGEEKLCRTCLRRLTLRENTDGSTTLWCLPCSSYN